MDAIPREFPDCHGTAVASIAACIASCGDARSLPEVAGRTGLAFRACFAEGARRGLWSAFPFAPTLARAFDHLGYDADLVSCSADDLLVEPARHRARRLVETALDSGRASLLWSPFDVPEFGIVVGRRGVRWIVLGRASGGVASGVLDPATLARRPEGPSLFVARATVRHTVDPRAADRAALALALREIRGGDWSAAGVHTGHAALEAWCLALGAGGDALDPAGHACLLAALAEARGWAASFLTDRAEAIPEESPALDAAIALVHAANDLDASAQLFGGIARESLREPADLRRAERRAAAAGAIATARRREESAAGRLEEALAVLARG